MKLNLKNSIRLLSLLSIFFIWKIIDAAIIQKNDVETLFWSIFLVIYVASLIILYVVFYWYQNRKQKSPKKI